MDLRNHTITVGELLDNPRSRAVFQRRFGKLMNHPMVGAARSLTLRQLAEMAAVYLPKKTTRTPCGSWSSSERSLPGRPGLSAQRLPRPLKTYPVFSHVTGCQPENFRIE